MHRKGGIGEGESKLRQRLPPLVAAMQHGDQVGDGQMAPAVGAVRGGRDGRGIRRPHRRGRPGLRPQVRLRSEEHTSELQSLMRTSYAVFCLKKKNINTTTTIHYNTHIVKQQ